MGVAGSEIRKVAIITGSNSGIGRDLAEHLHNQSYNVALVGRRLREGLQSAAQLDPNGQTAVFIQCDVVSYEDQVRLFKAVWDKWQRIDALVTNAGVVDHGSRCTDIDFKAVVYGTELAVHYMRHNPRGARGKIILTGSLVAIYQNSLFPEYSAVEAASLHWARVMAPVLLRQDNVTINIVLPNAYETPVMPDYNEAYLDEHYLLLTSQTNKRILNLVTKGCLMSAYDVFLQDETNQMTGKAIETARDKHDYYEVPEYKSGRVIGRTDKVYEPWFRLLRQASSGLDNAIKEPMQKVTSGGN